MRGQRGPGIQRLSTTDSRRESKRAGSAAVLAPVTREVARRPFGRRATGTGQGQLGLQETDGQVHWPLGETVKLQLLPLPFGLATITYWLGQLALTFDVE